jgi:hypothetical protein
MSEGHSDSLKPDGRGRYALQLEREECTSAGQDNDWRWPLWVESRLMQERVVFILLRASSETLLTEGCLEVHPSCPAKIHSN